MLGVDLPLLIIQDRKACHRLAQDLLQTGHLILSRCSRSPSRSNVTLQTTDPKGQPHRLTDDGNDQSNGELTAKNGTHYLFKPTARTIRTIRTIHSIQEVPGGGLHHM